MSGLVIYGLGVVEVATLTVVCVLARFAVLVVAV